MRGLALEEALVRLASGQAEPPAGLSDARWQALDDRAGEHRLRPLLHACWHGYAAIPDAVGRRWQEAHRASALTALAQRAELILVAERLADAGIENAALKGAWLAWHAYPDAALRPLRDLDVLVRRDQALQARGVLLASGWSEVGIQGLDAEEWLVRFKHLPPLVSQQGTVLEVHTRLADEGTAPAVATDTLLARSVGDPDHPALRYLSPPDLLMHLSIHACAHRFDGGPLMLVDFVRLLERVTFDWEAVWTRAHDEGWHRKLALCLAGAARWAGAHPPPLPVTPPPKVIEGLPSLLAKPLSAREGDLAAAKLARGGLTLREKLRRALVRRERHSSLAGYLGWFGSQLRGAIAAGRNGRAKHIAAMDRWLVR